MSLLTIRADDVAPVPWKNGGGITRDLLLWPRADALRVRLSLADITQDGPFSPYPGVTRWFAVIEGAGVELQFASGSRLQRQADAPLCFDGADAPGCRLLDGMTRDLNVLLHGGARGTLQQGPHFDEDWPLRGRFDRSTRTLLWNLPPGALHGPADSLWIGVAP
ncbi:MAG: HutD family protein [Rubrivivax sp.]